MFIDAHFVADKAPLFVGFMLMGVGLFGVLNPLSGVHHFGFPWAEESHGKVYAKVAVRNFSAGLATIIMSLMGNRDSVGIFLASWTVVGVVDTYIVYSENRNTQKVLHPLNTLIVGLLGALILCEGRYDEWTDTLLLTGLSITAGTELVYSWLLG